MTKLERRWGPKGTRSLRKLFGGRVRRIGHAGARAFIEIRMPPAERFPQFGGALEEAIVSVRGVEWAEVNPYVQRVIVSYDEQQCDLEQLVEAVERVEQEQGLGSTKFPLDVEDHPADDEPLLRNTTEMVASASGAVLAVLVRASRFQPSRFHLDLRELVSIVKNTPRLRGLLEERLGYARTDVVLNLTGTLLHSTSGSVWRLVLKTLYRLAQRSEIMAARRVWERRKVELCMQTPRPHPSPRLEPRPVPLPPGPVEQYARGAWNLSLGGFAVGIVDTQALSSALAPLVDAVPKPAHQGRELFATQLHRVLASRGIVCRQARVLRRLDRIDTVVVEASMLLNGARAMGRAIPLEQVGLQEIRQQASGLFDVNDPMATQESNGWKLAPLEERDRDRAKALGDKALGLMVDGKLVGAIETVPALEPAVRDLLSAVRKAGLSLVLAVESGVGTEALAADQVLPGGDQLTDTVLELQKQGKGVALVAASNSDALAASDCGIGLCREGRGVPWGAHLLCSDTLDEATLVVESIAAAKRVSRESASLSVAGSTVGALLTLGGLRKDSTRKVKSAVNTAAAIAMINGLRAARRLQRSATTSRRDDTPWHELGHEETLQKTESSSSGLTQEQAAQRVEKQSNGKRHKPALLKSIVGELDNPLTPVLGAGAAAAAGIGSPGDAAIVGAAIGLNAVVGGIERYRAERAIAALEHTETREVNVRRGGKTTRLRTDNLVKGDVLEIGPSDVVPADCRILEASSLEVDESSLTGESLPVGKSADATSSPIVAERTSMLFEGTSVVAGKAIAVVVATGDQTESRRGLRAHGKQGKQRGTDARLRAITDITLPVAMASGAVLVGTGLLRGRRIRQMAPAGVSLSIAAVPEGLPLLSTAAQLAASKRLSGRGALVRNPAAMEALGRVDVLCADKTGTLTEGRLKLKIVSDGKRRQKVAELEDSHREVLAAGLRATPDPDEEQALSHPTDKAVVGGGKRSNTDQDGDGWERMSELPFEPSRGYHASLGRRGESTIVSIKGAPEVVLPKCNAWMTEGAAQPLDGAQHGVLEEEAKRLADEGLRVLVVAERQLDGATELTEDHVESLVFRGFLGLSDPTRPAAVQAIKKLQEAGAKVIMITGDHPNTAASIARELGLVNGSGDEVLTGPDIDHLDDESLGEAIAHKSVVARATPSQKVRIVEALQRAGRTVAMTGDGANDAAAIRLADVGIALGEKSTSAARSAADLVVVDERIETIVDAIVEGRSMWSSVRDAVSILIGGNLGEIAYTVASGTLTTDPPLNARQLMLVNLLTDVAPSMAVAVQPPKQTSAELLRAGPSGALGQSLTHDILWRALVTSGSALGAWLLTNLYDRRRASTVGLLALVGSQLGQTIALGGREKGVLKSSLGSEAVLLAVVQTPGVSRLVGCRPVGIPGLLTAVAASATSGFLARRAPERIPFFEQRFEAIVARAEEKEEVAWG